MLRRRCGGLLVLLCLLAALPGCGFEPGLNEEKTLPLSADLIVIGSGIGGLTASLEAARQGAAVILFAGESPDESWLWEEGALLPGEGAGAGVLQEALAAQGRGGKKWHFKLLSRNAATDLAWLSRETGLRMIAEDDFRAVPENLSKVHPDQRLREKVVQEGVRFIEGAVPKQLLFGAGGAAAGISFGNGAAQSNEAYAPAVIIADGGVGALTEGQAPKVVLSGRGAGSGTGLSLARAAGMDLVDETKFAYALARESEGEWVPVNPPPETLVIIDEQLSPFSQHGERGLVELLGGTPGGSAYLLLPEEGTEADGTAGWSRYRGIASFLESVKLDLPELKRRFRNPEAVFRGCLVKPAAVYCLGGLAVDESGRVLRGGEPVEGLYALGEAAGGLNGAALAPGAALTEALVWGRFLGAAAVGPQGDN